MKKTHTTITMSPFTYLTPSIKNTSLIILAVLVPQLLLLFITRSYNSLLLIALAVFASIFTEFLSNRLQNQKSLYDFQAIVQGVFIGLLIPSNYPLIPFVCILIISLFLIKYFFGGFSHSWINPVAFTIIVAYLLGLAFFNVDIVFLDYINVKEPITELINQGNFRVLPIDKRIIDFLNKSFFSYLGSEINPGYLSYMWDSYALIPAFRFGFLTLLASIVLFSLDVLRYYVPLAFILSYALLVALFAQTKQYGIFGQGDILFALFSSGFLFSAFFLLDWPGTSPLNPLGKIMYGIISGILAFLLVGSGQSAIGIMFTILIANIISPLMQIIELSMHKQKLHQLLDKS